MGISVFVFFSCFLSTRSAYSYSMGLTLVLSVIYLPALRNFKAEREVKILALFFLFLSIFWSNSFDGWLAWSTEGDYFIKYALGAFCVFAVCAIGVQPKVLAYSIALGCISSGVLAILQFPETGRSAGYTNAIRFGNIAVLLTLASWFFAMVKSFAWMERSFFFLAGMMGILASLLSLSRGGWLLLFFIPFFVLFFTENKRQKWRIIFLTCIAGGIAVFAMFRIPALHDRIDIAKEEASGYFENRDAYIDSSVGVRLEQWKMGWRLGLEKPISGWGDKGIKDGKTQQVLNGGIHPSALNIPHTHNEIIEMWASRGIIGVFFILSVYIVPAYIFFPRKKKISSIEIDKQALYIALHLSGFIIPIGYFVFGWTDVFFNLSIGHNFFIFTMIYIMASIQWVNRNFSKAMGN